MAILVTGGAGYIGSHCVAALIERGADVVVVDDLSKGHREALKGGRLYVGSVADRAFLDDVFSREPIEAVIHFAAFSWWERVCRCPNSISATTSLPG